MIGFGVAGLFITVSARILVGGVEVRIVKLMEELQLLREIVLIVHDETNAPAASEISILWTKSYKKGYESLRLFFLKSMAVTISKLSIYLPLRSCRETETFRTRTEPLENVGSYNISSAFYETLLLMDSVLAECTPNPSGACRTCKA